LPSPSISAAARLWRVWRLAKRPLPFLSTLDILRYDTSFVSFVWEHVLVQFARRDVCIEDRAPSSLVKKKRRVAVRRLLLQDIFADYLDAGFQLRSMFERHGGASRTEINMS
jgi:hypothetical protein